MEIEEFLVKDHHQNNPVKFLETLKEVYEAVNGLNDGSATVKVGKIIIRDVLDRVNRTAIPQARIILHEEVPIGMKATFKQDFEIITGVKLEELDG